jgi:hypothetical protein
VNYYFEIFYFSKVFIYLIFVKGIIGKQFRDWKFGDRFYFETSDKALRFTRDQLDSIREVTMARLLCDHIDVDFLQQFAFFIAKKNFNPLVDCKSITELDLSLWSNENVTVQSCTIKPNATEAVASATVSQLAEVFEAVYTVLNDKLTTAIENLALLEEPFSAFPNTSVTNASSDVQSAIVTFAAGASGSLPAQYTSVSLSTLLQNVQQPGGKRRRRQAV